MNFSLPSEPTIRFSVDWISVTYQDKQFDAVHGDLGLDFFGENRPTPARPGYSHARRYANGATLHWHITRPDQGVHLVLGGQALSRLNDVGQNSFDVLETLVSARGKLSRIDLARDAINFSFGLPELCQLALVKAYKGTARTAHVITGSDGGQSLYLGSRESNRYLRAYNKAAETGWSGVWERLELELKNKGAEAIQREVFNNGIGNLEPVFTGLVKGMFKVDHKTFEDFLGQEAVSTKMVVRHERDTEKWLMEQVAPSIRKWLENGGDHESVVKFMQKSGITDWLDSFIDKSL